MGVFRGVASAAVLSLALGACSSVPDAINPVSWYEKTTDFFSGDSQAADTGTPMGATTADGQVAQNQGLAADPNAPPPAPAPAPAQAVTSAPSGLSADRVSGNYASPPIERQGAPSNVLTPQSQVASAPAPQVAPPAPQAAPQPRVDAVPAPQSSMPRSAPAPAPMPAPMDMASAPPPMPTMPTAPGAPAPTSAPRVASAAPTGPMTPPPPFEFPAPSAMTAYGGDSFETVVISADGMEAMPEPAAMPQLSMTGAPTAVPQASNGAQFPQPGATTGSRGTLNSGGPATVGGMVRVATIHFANNAANLDQRDRSILGAVVQLQKERGGRVVVVGHASARTKDMDYIKHQMVNFEISMNRAGTIGTVLKTMGLPAETLEVQAVSDTQPLFLEVMPSGEAGNRRVEIYLAAAAT